METRKALLAGDSEKLTTPHSTSIKEIDVIEKSIQDFAFTHNREILRGRAEAALDILDNWQPILFEEIPPRSSEKLISDEYLWLEDVLVAALMGWPPTLIETVSLYASSYPEGISREKLTLADKIGLELWSIFSSMPSTMSTILPNLASTTLIDDYHDVSPKRGEEFVLEAARFLLDIGIIREEQIPGRDYVLLRESSMMRRSQEMLALLEASGGEIIFQENESRFIPSEQFWHSSEILSKSRRKYIRNKGVLLFKDNKPSCPLMDAASYMRAINYHYLHVKIFPEQYKTQQDDTYTLLHAGKIVPKGQYHNLFFREEDGALQEILDLLRSGLKKIIQKSESYSEWSDFPYEGYASNYLPGVKARDRRIIEFVLPEINRLIQGGVGRVIDIGSGGNLYPGMLWTHLAEEISLWEYSASGRAWLRDEMRKDRWHVFGEQIDLLSKKTATWKKFAEKSKVQYGSVSDLLYLEHEALSAFFLAERITTHRVYLRMMIRRMTEALREGGVFVFVHALGSDPYSSEGDHLFPSVRVESEELQKIYNALPLEYKCLEIDAAEDDLDDAAGIAVFVGRKVPGELEAGGIINP